MKTNRQNDKQIERQKKKLKNIIVKVRQPKIQTLMGTEGLP